MKKILFFVLFVAAIMGANACDCYEDCKYKNDRAITYMNYDSGAKFVVNYHTFTPKINNTVTYYHSTIELSDVGIISVDLKESPASFTLEELLGVFYIEYKDTLLQ